MSDIGGGFDLKFDEQIGFFRKKINLPTAAWDDIWKSQHDRAFVVAGAMEGDLLNDLRQAVDRGIAEGTGLDEFRAQFKEIVARRGWHGWTGEGSEKGEAWRTRVIFETNLRTSYAAGRYAQLTDPDLLAVCPYWRYVHSDLVLHPRPEHKAWGDSNLTLPHDDPFWKTHFPPNGWGCGCTVTAVRNPTDGAATEPPEGWDAINPKTGEPPGIDKGWGYSPGASRDLSDLIADKAAKYPEPLKGDFLASQSSKTSGTIGADTAKPVNVPDRPGLDENAARYVIAQGKKDGVEHLYAYDAMTEKVYQQAKGSLDDVKLTAKMSKMLDTKGAAMVLHHNHPDSYSLSSADLVLLNRPGGWRVVAHGHDGSTFSATKAQSSIPFDMAINAARTEVFSQARVRMVEIEGWWAHLVNISLFRAGIINYEFSLAQSRALAYDRDAAIFDKIITEAVAAIQKIRP